MKSSISSGLPLEIELKNKGIKLAAAILILFSIIFLRLTYMQIIMGFHYKELSMNNSIRVLNIKPPRGKIMDRNGIVLVDNRPVCNLVVIPEDVSDPAKVSSRLAEILEMDPVKIEEEIKAGLKRPYDPVCIAKDLSFDQIARIESEIYTLPGVSIDATHERDYVYKELASHVLGYVGEVSEKELSSSINKKGIYSQGDVIGKGGIERELEEILRGRKGQKVLEVDATGHSHGIKEEISPLSGKDVRLTIDKDLQAIAADSLGDRAGAVIAMVPSTGEVLVMLSKPDYDPNMFLSPIAPEAWQEIIHNPRHPLENRAFRGQYPPGSIFKIVTTLAGLSTGVLDPYEKVHCSGDLILGDTRFMCWKQPLGHGDVDLNRAIIESCDVYFYRLGKMLGIDAFSSYALSLGFGQTTGIDLSGDSSGLIPSREWKRAKLKKTWYTGETLIMAIGQGFLRVTPLQMAKVMSAVVNGGDIYTPRLIASGEPKLEKKLDVPGEQLEIIKNALRGVVEDPAGTAHNIWDPVLSVGGKTGTAQVVKKIRSGIPDESDIPYRYRDHAWFLGFSPVDDPEILVIVVVEHGGHGGSIAAPIGRDVIKGYFFLKSSRWISGQS
jgi:penicillin-binding protein 2